VTTPPTAVVLPAMPTPRAAPVGTFADRIALAARRRAGRFRLAMLALALFLPLLATAVLAGR
jgi:hypothetical protein